MLKNYKDLKVWQKSYGLCLDIYRITRKFPKEERYRLLKDMEEKQLWIISGHSILAMDPIVS